MNTRESHCYLLGGALHRCEATMDEARRVREARDGDEDAFADLGMTHGTTVAAGMFEPME